jgi:hypothetical protein
MVIRGMLPNSCGNVHWSIAPIVKDSTLVEELIKGPYQKQAAVPKSSWLWNKNPHKISAKTEMLDQEIRILPEISSAYKTQLWVVYYKYGNKWEYTINSVFEKSFSLKTKKTDGKKAVEIPLEQIGISVIDRYGNESEINYIEF